MFRKKTIVLAAMIGIAASGTGWAQVSGMGGSGAGGFGAGGMGTGGTGMGIGAQPSGPGIQQGQFANPGALQGAFPSNPFASSFGNTAFGQNSRFGPNNQYAAQWGNNPYNAPYNPYIAQNGTAPYRNQFGPNSSVSQNSGDWSQMTTGNSPWSTSYYGGSMGYGGTGYGGGTGMGYSPYGTMNPSTGTMQYGRPFSSQFGSTMPTTGFGGTGPGGTGLSGTGLSGTGFGGTGFGGTGFGGTGFGGAATAFGTQPGTQFGPTYGSNFSSQFGGPR